MEITVEGWSRNHGTHSIARKAIVDALPGGPIKPGEIGYEISVTNPQDPTANKVSVYFHTKLLGASGYLARLNLSFEDIDKLYAVSLERRGTAEATKALATHL